MYDGISSPRSYWTRLELTMLPPRRDAKRAVTELASTWFRYHDRHAGVLYCNTRLPIPPGKPWILRGIWSRWMALDLIRTQNSHSRCRVHFLTF